MQNYVLSPIDPDKLVTDIAVKVYEKLKGLFPPPQPAANPDELLTVPQAAELLHLTVPTIYGLIHKGQLPAMKQGKRVYFYKRELLEWVRAGRKKSIADYAAEADNFLTNHKNKGGKK